MEIITHPDFRSAIEAASFIKELQLILQTIGTCDGRMEGQLLFIFQLHRTYSYRDSVWRLTSGIKVSRKI
jgi:GatB/GatE catalytic domain